MDNKITIKQVGYTYVFEVAAIISQEVMDKLKEDIRRQLKEGCVILPANIRLISVEPRLEIFVKEGEKAEL